MTLQNNLRKLVKVGFSVWSASLGLALAQQAPFSDVPANLESIRFLYEKGIVQGYPDGTFRGREYMTRYQVAAMLYRTYLVFADDVAKRVREALAQDSQARLEEALAAISDLQEALKIVQEALEDYPEVKANLEETRKNVEGLAEELAQVSSQMVTREEIGELLGSVGALENLIKRGEADLRTLQARVNALEQVIRDLEGRTQAAQGELNKKVFELGGRVDTLEKKGKNAPRLTVGGSVGLSDGQPDGEVFVQGEANGVRLTGRLSQAGVQVRAEQGGLALEHRSQNGVAESRGDLKAFEGVALKLSAGYGDSAFGVASVVHEPDGGLVPGLVAEGGVGAGFHEGNLSRNLLFARVGYRFGNLTPTLGYYRYQGEEPYSLLEGRLDWKADFGSLGGYYRLVAFPGSGTQGSEWGVQFQSNSNPFLELGFKGVDGLVAGEPGSFSFRYQNATASRTDFTVRVGYKLGF